MQATHTDRLFPDHMMIGNHRIDEVRVIDNHEVASECLPEAGFYAILRDLKYYRSEILSLVLGVTQKSKISRL